MTVRLPFDQLHPLAVPPELRALRTGGSIHRVRTAIGDHAWLVTEHTLVRTLLSDPRLGRAHPDPGKAARTGRSALFGGPAGSFETEQADHARMRALLQPHFTPKLMWELRPRVDALTAGLLDDLADHGPPADLHTALALPLPILVICELLGVPYEDRDRFRGWSEAAGNVVDGDRSLEGVTSLYAYGKELVVRRRAAPGDDVITRLATTDGVSDDEAAMLSVALLFAGHETTVVRIGMGALMLLANPDQWQVLLDDPTLLPGAVEEVLRASNKGGGGIPRYARTDLDIDGTTVLAGDLVLLDTGAANHDPTAFPDPDRLDVTRNAAAHLAFGHGLRYCIGTPLARIELRSAFTQLLDRFPTMRLDTPVDQLAIRHDTLTGGLTALPVTW